MYGGHISYSNESRGNLRHNNRDFVSKNVDKERIEKNVELINDDMELTYGELFNGAVKAYNAKQTRDDRKIEDYYEKLFRQPASACNGCIIQNRNKQYNFYEYVVGIGGKEETGFAEHPEAAAIAVECLREYIEGNPDLGVPSFQDRNPNFRVFNAVIHCDEATPHLHYDFIPYADGFKTGMTRQQGIAKALAAMGYGTGKGAIEKFTTTERGIFRKICEAHGFEVAAEEKGRGFTLRASEYGKMKDEVKKEIAAEVRPEIVDAAEEKAKQILESADEKIKGWIVEAVAETRKEQKLAEQARQQRENDEKATVAARSERDDLQQQITVLNADKDTVIAEIDDLETRKKALDIQVQANVVMAAKDIPPRPVVNPLPDKPNLAQKKEYKKQIAAAEEWDKINGGMAAAQVVIQQQDFIINNAKIKAENTVAEAEVAASRINRIAQQRDEESRKDREAAAADRKKAASMLQEAKKRLAEATLKAMRDLQKLLRENPIARKLYQDRQQQELDRSYNAAYSSPQEQQEEQKQVKQPKQGGIEL